MDAFYASVEQRDNQNYQGKPLVVGSKSERGVISAASYEARKYGVYSAMSAKKALKKCPFLLFVPPRFHIYRKVSIQIRQIFELYTDIIEPLALDEAFLDVTKNHFNIPSATIIAQKIKKEIKEKLNLTASAGVSYNKFLAKIASDYDKPDGLYVIKPDKGEEFVEKLKIEKFFGIGKVTAKKLHHKNIYFGSDLKKLDEYELKKIFGKNALFYYNIVRGIDEREVNPFRETKSIGAENTFNEDISSKYQQWLELEKIALLVYERLEKKNKYGRTLTLKVKFYDFKQITRSKTVKNNINSVNKILEITKDLFNNEDIRIKPIRLLGISISNFDIDKYKEKVIQLTFSFKN